MALNYTDRRRILLATTLTVLTLPALWLANQSESAGAPNVATVGVEVGSGHEQSATAEAAISTFETPLNESEPVFLDGPAPIPNLGIAEVAVPAAQNLLTASATYSSYLSNLDVCVIAGVPNGSIITVVNLDNNRSTTCVSMLAPTGSSADLILHTHTFSQIADLTDAPIPVEIRQ